jgi:hypothetical protein
LKVTLDFGSMLTAFAIGAGVSFETKSDCLTGSGLITGAEFVIYAGSISFFVSTMSVFCLWQQLPILN